MIVPPDAHAILDTIAHAALAAYRHAKATLSADELHASAGIGADGTETYELDVIVEGAVLDALGSRANVLSEEIGWVDHASALTVVLDPVDGTANAVDGVPLSCFAAALAIDGELTEAVAVWLDTGKVWWARRGRRGTRALTAPEMATTARRTLDGASLSMLRPRPETSVAWNRLAERARRVRVLGSSVLEGCLVAEGAIDAFCDPGGDVHRIVDLAAVQVLVEAAGGVLVDLHGRPLTLEPDLTLRWSGVVAASASLADEIVTAVIEVPV